MSEQLPSQEPEKFEVDRAEQVEVTAELSPEQEQAKEAALLREGELVVAAATRKQEAAPEQAAEQSVDQEPTPAAESNAEVPSSEEVKKLFLPADEAQPLPPPSNQVKTYAKNANLQVIRARLSAPEKQFSRFIHKPFVNSISEVTAKTLLRPAAFLCAAICTLVGSSYYVYVAKQTGYKYNFTVGLLLFVGGFVVGLVLELLYHVFARRSSQ